MSADEKYYDEKHLGAGTPPYNEKEDAVVSAVPVEEEDLETTHVGDHHLRRDLVSSPASPRRVLTWQPPRVVSMIAIAGTIGTGLFLGSGTALTMGGPVGMWLGYTFIGFGVGFMMQSLGEMVCYRPNVGESHAHLCLSDLADTQARSSSSAPSSSTPPWAS